MIQKYAFIVLLWIDCCFNFTIKDWGENCTHSDECFDHRMVCVLDERNVTRCFCDRFYGWNESSSECIPIYSIEYIMNQTVTVHDYKGKLERMQDLMFRGPVYSIYFMVFVIAAATVSVIIYCLYIRSKDYHLKEVVVHLTVETEDRKRRKAMQQSSTSQSEC